MITVNKDLLNRISVKVENATFKVQGTGSLICFDDVDYAYVITAKHCIYGKQFSYENETKAKDCKIFLPKIYEDDFEEFQVLEIIENNDYSNYDVVILVVELQNSPTNQIKYYPQRNNGDTFYIKGFPKMCDDKGITFDINHRENIEDSLDTFRVNIGKIEVTSSQRQHYLEGISGSGVFKPHQSTFYLVGVIIEVTDAKVAYNSLNCVSLKLINQTLKKKGKRLLDLEAIPEVIQKYWDRFNKVIKQIGPRYRPEFNIELPIQDNFQALSKDKTYWDNFLEEFDELYQKYNKIHLQKNWKHQEVKDGVKRIKDSFIPVFNYVKSINYTTEQSIGFNKISSDLYKIIDLIGEEQKEIRKINYSLPEVTINPYHKERPYDILDREIREFTYQITTFQRFLNSPKTQLINNPFLLITGKAGNGKTHLLCDVAKNRLEENQSIVLFLNNEFHNHEPKEQLLKLFNWEGSWITFLEKLNYEGSINQRRSLIFIDALNEGEGRYLWQKHIISIIEDIKEYPWIGLVVSVRTPYKDFVIPKTLLDNKEIIEIEHEGFTDAQFKAMQVIFAHFEVPLPSIVPLNPEFSNPLFLITLCEGLSERKITIFPKGFRGISKVFKFFISVKQEKIVKHLGIDPKSKIVIKALKQIAKKMVDNNNYEIERDDATTICDNLLPHRSWDKSLLQTLLSEGLLIESRQHDYKEDEWIDIVQFGYERFGDHEKVAYVLEKYFDKNQPSKIYDREHPLGRIIQSYGYYETELLALAIQLPEKYDIEIFDIADKEYHPYLINAFLDSLAWRDYTSIDVDKVIDIFNTIIVNIGLIQEKLLEIATDEEHPFNAHFLHKHLLKFTLAERDEDWSIFLHYLYQNDKNTYPTRLIDWAWKYSPKITHLTDETIKLTAITLSWFLTSANRYLRDTSTKALVSLLRKRTNVLIDILELFHTVNDIYIVERLYAVAYGVILNLSNKDEIKLIAQKIYDLIFKDGNPPVHFLLRDYARLSIERAIYLGVELNVNVEQIQPPYNSQWIEPPTEKEIEKYNMHKLKKGDWTEEERGQGILYSSVVSIGDFSRYIIGTNGHTKDWTDIKFSDKRKYENFIQTATKNEKALIKILETVVTAEFNIKENKSIRLGILSKDNRELIEKYFTVERFLKDNKVYFSNEKYQLLINHIIPYLEAVQNSRRYFLKSFDLSIIQRFIIHKVFELGWTRELFGKVDASINKYNNYSHSTKKSERIGKKYQWIAYHEILARLADRFEYKNDYTKNEVGALQGPWYYQGHGRDIDPTSLYFKDTNSPKHFKRVFQEPDFNFTETSFDEWLNTDNDFPNVLNIIEKTDREGKVWIMLQGRKSWDEPRKIGEDRYDRTSKNIYLNVETYFVKKSRLGRLYNWSLKQNFFNNPITRATDRYELHYKEFYWSPVYDYLDNRYDGIGVNDWFVPNNDGKLRTKVLETTENYLNEGGGYDCSTEDGISINMPCKLIVEQMPLFYGDRDGDWVNENEELTFLDATIYEKGIGSFMDKKKLIQFLDKNDLAMIWTIGGEKLVAGMNDRNSRVYSGVYKLNDNREWEGDVRGFFRDRT